MEGIIIPALQPKDEAKAVKETEEGARSGVAKEGDKVYLISNRWFTQWCQYSGFTIDTARKGRVTIADLAEPGPRPGPIDSSDLLAEESSGPAGGGPSGREPDLNEEERGRLMCLRDKLPPTAYFEAREPTYSLLKDWYGVEGPEVFVELMQVGPARRLETELHPLHLKAVLEASQAEIAHRSAVVAISKQCTVKDLKRRCCTALGVAEDDYVIMDFYGMDKATKLEDKWMKTMSGANVLDQQAVLLRHKDRAKEVEDEEREEAAALASTPPSLMRLGTSPGYGGLAMSPPPSSPLSRSHSKPPTWATDDITTAASRRRGLAGLGNLGNTCFMNSSVQCLAHTVPVMETFLSGRYKADINADNPLGMGGKLATAFGSLMEKLWHGGVSSVTPRRFKWQLARFAPQFQGYAQQDSQELLAFLLDGLHEDLNRIQNKPYIEEKDDDGRPDAALAQEAWANYRARNDSVIVDNFQGLYKSTLVCPRCQSKSRKFDPFMYLSLPLPTAKTRAFSVVVVHMDGSQPPMQYSVEVPKNATMRQLYVAVGKLLGIEEDGPSAAAAAGDAAAAGPSSSKESAAERVLLMAQVAQSSLSYSAPKTQFFTDMEARVSAIKEPARGGFFSSARPALLLAYRYASPEEGPCSSKRPVLVVHKVASGRGSSAGGAPPTPLFLAEEDVAALQLEPVKAYYSTEWAVKDQASTALDAATRRMLRPFSKHPELEQQQAAMAAGSPPPPPPPLPPAAGDGHAARTGGDEDSMSDAPDAVVPSAGAAAAAGHSGAGGAAAAEEEEGMGEAMDLEQPDTPPAEALTDASPAGSSGGGDEEMATYVPVSAAAALEGDEGAADSGAAGFIGPQLPPAGAAAGGDSDVFDMWAGQTAAAQQQQQQQAAAVAEPYQLKLATGLDGRAQTAYSDTEAPPDLAAESGTLFFVAAWTPEGAAAYDPGLVERPARHQSVLDADAAAAGGSKKVTLADCMETFLQPEKLEVEESWYCSRCKEHVQADKKLDLWSLPEVLVVHLKRFSYSRYSRNKLDTDVAFPLEGLDLSPYLLQLQEGQGGGGGQQGGSCVYDLFAVSNHFGGLGGGHYTAYCKMPDDGRWYCFDDSSVREASPADVASPAAYVLFYRRKGGSQVDLGELFSEAQQAPEGAAAAAAAAAGLEMMESSEQELQFPLQVGSP